MNEVKDGFSKDYIQFLRTPVGEVFVDKNGDTFRVVRQSPMSIGVEKV
jgi:hypothetical protein